MAPQINPSSWVKFAERDSLARTLDYPGVYLLAHFKSSPQGPAETKTKEIILIGETHNRTLRQRLREFHNVISTGKGSHGPADTYREKFSQNKADNLFLAVFPVTLQSRAHQKSYAQYLERRLIWEYVEENGEYPACNRE